MSGHLLPLPDQKPLPDLLEKQRAASIHFKTSPEPHNAQFNVKSDFSAAVPGAVQSY